MKVVVDNFAILGVEFCLLEKLSDTISSETVMNLEDGVVEEIAAEQPDSKVERARALTKFQSPEAGLQTLRRFGRHKPGGKEICRAAFREDQSDLVHDFDSVSETCEEDVSVDGIATGQDTDEDGILEKDCASGTLISSSPENAGNLSPFDGSGTIKDDKSWRLNGSPRLSNTKKRTILWE